MMKWQKLKRQFVVRGHYTDRTGNKDNDTCNSTIKVNVQQMVTGILGQMM